jgi:Cd2+/Zn2+-exporting ATPase
MNRDDHGRAHSSCGCQPKEPRHTEQDGHNHSDGIAVSQTVLVASSGAVLGIGIILEAFHIGPRSLPIVCFAISTIAGAALVFPHALSSIRRLRLDMNVLMSAAVAGAWLIGQGEEAAAVVFLFALAELLESWSVGRARRAVQTLLALAPETAFFKTAEGKVDERPARDAKVGDVVVVRSGQRIPLDGTIEAGTSSVNQAPITGESVPVEKEPGASVFAGTINGEGVLEVKVTKTFSDSTLSRIIKLVAEAEEQKAPTQQFVDRFARVYTPAVFVLALLVAVLPPLLSQGLWSEWIYRSLVLLVIACPCALVIATPVSIVSGLTALARRGVLVKGGAHLEAIGKLKALAVDKTGTITRGKPELTGIHSFGSSPEERILTFAAAIDANSTHPLAEAVTAEARKRNVKFDAGTDYRSRTGRGAEAVIDGHRYFIGNHKMAHEFGICTPEAEQTFAAIEDRGESLAILGHMPHADCKGELLGVLSIGDTMREEAPAALKALHAAGIQKVVMLSGDNQKTASTIASKAGIDEAFGDLLPEDKVTRIRELVSTYGHVGMIGDGVNDAPALAAASIGIAMGAVGSDTAIETADVALMNDDLTKLASAILAGRRTLRIIKFNVAFALIVKAVFLLLALTGHTSLWLAILADTGATLLVIANALRLLRD